MKKSLLNLIGMGMLGLSVIGCAGNRCRTLHQPQPEMASSSADENSKITEPKKAEDKKENANNWKLSAYSSERVGDTVLSSGYHVGEFPALTNDTGVTLENERFSMTGWRYSVFNKGFNVEEDYGISTSTKLTDKLSLLADIQDWGYAGIHNSVVVLGGNFNAENGIGAKFQTYECIDDGGQLYYLNLSKKLGDKVTANISTAYSNDFLGSGKFGMQHITPGVSVKLPSLGPVDFSGDVQYQFGLNGQRDSFWYGAITASIATPKVELKKK